MLAIFPLLKQVPATYTDYSVNSSPFQCKRNNSHCSLKQYAIKLKWNVTPIRKQQEIANNLSASLSLFLLPSHIHLIFLSLTLSLSPSLSFSLTIQFNLFNLYSTHVTRANAKRKALIKFPPNFRNDKVYCGEAVAIYLFQPIISVVYFSNYHKLFVPIHWFTVSSQQSYCE